LVEPGDVHDLAEKVLAVLDKPDLRAPLPQSVVDEVARRNGREAALSGHLGLYDELLRRPLQH
jgi:hypothetical protein